MLVGDLQFYGERNRELIARAFLNYGGRERNAVGARRVAKLAPVGRDEDLGFWWKTLGGHGSISRCQKLPLTPVFAEQPWLGSCSRLGPRRLEQVCGAGAQLNNVVED